MIYVTKCDVSALYIKQICSKFLEGKNLLMSYALSLELLFNCIAFLQHTEVSESLET